MSSKVVAPAGMSRADALRGLWECSPTPFGFYKDIEKHPTGAAIRLINETGAWKSRDKVEQMIQAEPRVHYFGARCIKTDMSKYPEIDLASYKKECEINMSYAQIFQRCLNRNR